MKAASRLTGSVSPVITVERHELRKRKTTRTVRNAPSRSALWTFSTDCSTRTPEFCTTRSSTPSGSEPRSASTRSSTALATAVVL